MKVPAADGLGERLLGWGTRDERMQRELVESYHGQMTPLALLGNVLAAGGVTATLWDPGAAPALLAWFALVCAVALGNGLKQRAYDKGRNRHPPARWALLFWLGSPANGFVWGAAMPLFFDPGNLGGSLLLLVLQGGLSAGAVVTMASIPGTAMGFFVPALLATAATLLAHDDLGLRVTGGMTLFYMVVLVQLALRGHAGLMRAIHLYMENARLSQAKTDFLAVMSHEIRTPMNGMLGAVHLLKTMPLDADARAAVNVAERTGTAMLAVIDDILDFTRITDGRLETEWAPFDLPGVLDDVQAIMGLRAEQKGLSFTVRIDPALPAAAMGDAGRLRQVLLNLTGNAVKFTETGGVRLSVCPDPDEPEWVRIDVTDTGIGIHADTLDRLFEPFTQADASISRRFGGTGLGLAICRRLTEAMGGTIGVRSRPGEGSTFWLRLPLPPADAGTPADAAARDSSASGAISRRILVVDDDVNNRFVLAGLLAVMGHRVEEAGDGEQALAMLATHAVDVVLTDLQMTPMSGYDLVHRIRRLAGAVAAVPVVAVTANVTAGVVEQCLAAGMDGHLSKPVMPDRLRDAIDAVCAGRAPAPPDPADSAPTAAAFIAELERHLGAEATRRLVAQAADAIARHAADLKAAGHGDREAARRAAHRLAGSAGLAGLADLSRAAASMEAAFAEGRTDGMDADLAALDAQAERSVDALRLAYSSLAQKR